MCTYISAIIPKSADLDRLSPIAASFNKNLRPFRNSSIQKLLISSEDLFLTTNGHCDCGSVLGSDRYRRRKVRDLDEERTKLAKKGWSKGKIEKALSQRLERILEKEQDQNSHVGKDLENWLGFLQAALAHRDTPYVGLLIHHYSGNIETEQVCVSGRQTIATSDLNQGALTGLDEDVIYQISAHV